MNWYEDDSTWEHVGYVEFGHHSVYEFEVYRNKFTGEIVMCDHEEPDQPGEIMELVEFAQDYLTDPNYKEQSDDFKQLMKSLNVPITAA